MTLSRRTAAGAVRQLDEHWDGRGQPSRLRGDAIPILARVACLAQTAEVFIAHDGLEAARAMVRVRRGRWFDPAVADAFLGLPDADALFADLAADRVASAPADGALVSADDGRLDRIAEAFASMIENTEAILRRLPIFAPLAVPAAAHHERVNGRGYHRVLACADVYDALTARRPYRDPMPSDAALALMRNDVGAAFFAEPFAALCAHVEALPLAA